MSIELTSFKTKVLPGNIHNSPPTQSKSFFSTIISAVAKFFEAVEKTVRKPANPYSHKKYGTIVEPKKPTIKKIRSLQVFTEKKSEEQINSELQKIIEQNQKRRRRILHDPNNPWLSGEELRRALNYQRY